MDVYKIFSFLYISEKPVQHFYTSNSEVSDPPFMTRKSVESQHTANNKRAPDR